MNKLISAVLLTLFGCMLLAADFEAERGSRVAWARLKFPVKGNSVDESEWDWNAHPSGDLRLIRYFRQYSPVNMLEDWNVVDSEHLEKMCAFPLIFVHGQRPHNFSARAKANLKEYVLRGGFLYIDDCVYEENARGDQFYHSMRRLLAELFPNVRIERVNPGHELFNCCFEIRSFPHCQGANNGISLIWLNGRLIGAITSSDLHCGWVGWFGNKTEDTLRMGVNVYIYAMTH